MASCDITFDLTSDLETERSSFVVMFHALSNALTACRYVAQEPS